MGDGAEHAGSLFAVGALVADDNVVLALVAFFQDGVGLRHDKTPWVEGGFAESDVALLKQSLYLGIVSQFG